ncbi:hypothetical protein [Xenorhabdus szentirmaii]|uniref:hypothetical protein n=1 Tax=Xenorhabdus szentirmaii TaxID=290112 RepID=UPI000C04F74B|nr:hypothetical protein [Xenorhabdus szentirmaii]PHM42370.1 hypothetical protein Xszus_02104 [Xenorhabdus szentirmaii]
MHAPILAKDIISGSVSPGSVSKQNVIELCKYIEKLTEENIELIVKLRKAHKYLPPEENLK